MERLGSGIVLLRGASTADMAQFYQDHEFYYLTGVTDPDCAMMLFPETGEQWLFVPPFSRFTATWEGARHVPGAKTAKALKFDQAKSERTLKRTLRELMEVEDGEELPKIWTLLSPSPNRTATSNSASGAVRRQKRDFLDRRPARHEAMRERLESMFDGVRVGDISHHVNAMRGVKDVTEIEHIAAATDAAVHGIAEAMKSSRVGMYEYQLAACARYVFSRLGAGPDAYAAIVGAGPNGCVLHYNENSRKLVDGDLIVMDYGPTVRGYATDVTRTFPANGKFTAVQRKLVQDVHEVQKALIAEVRPGASLAQLGRMSSKLLSERGYTSIHGPCHHVGLAVHDMGGDVLKPGMVITVEPGAYLTDEGMGCRIEDTILVTADGCRNLSASLPADPDSIEALMAADGIAQQPIGLQR